MANKKISGLPAAGALTGAELVELVKGGVNVQSTAQDIADLGGGGGGGVTSVTGTPNRITSSGGTTPAIDISASYAGQSSIITTGTLTGGATGAGFTVALGTSTLTGRIGESNMVAKYIIDSATPSTAGSTITLDFVSQIQRIFVGSATFATPKTVALDNATVALVLDFHFEVTNVAAVLTFPSTFLMSDSNWNLATKEWTPPATGKYEGGAVFDGTNWKLKINGPFL
jgi:hypothetical protein